MVMRSIPDLLNDSSSHISIAIPKHLREGSPLPSSSSDSDEDVDELPFIPMPLHMEFSGSRMSLNEIQSNEKETERQEPQGKPSGSPVQTQVSLSGEPKQTDKDELEPAGKGRLRKRSSPNKDESSSDEEAPAELPQKSELSRKPLRRGSSMESDQLESGRRRGELRRGGSADSALLLRITPEEEAAEGGQDEGRKSLKKAVSMELPRRSTSPGTTKMSQEDYALKLELMRQRLLRDVSVDKNKMSGLRGPLLETLAMGDEKRTVASDRYSRTARLGPPPLTRAASSDSAKDEASKPKVLRKTASFSQGDSEPIALHRRSGAPLEIPLAQVEERKLKEAISMSALTEQIKLDSRPVTPREPSPKPPTPDSVRQESPIKTESEESFVEKEVKRDDIMNEKMDGLTTDGNFDERSSTSGFSEKDMSISEEPMMESEIVGQIVSTPTLEVQSSNVEDSMEVEVEKEQGAKEEFLNKEFEEDKERINIDESYLMENDIYGENGQLPAESSDAIVSMSSVAVRPTEEHTDPPASVVSTYVTPLPPTQALLPDGRRSAYASIMQTIMVPTLQPLSDQPLGPSTPVVVPSTLPSVESSQTPVPVTQPVSVTSASPGTSKPTSTATTEHPAVYSRVASPELVSKEPSPPKTPSQLEPSAGADIEDISSEEVFEARFKKRESSLSRSLKFLTRSKNEQKVSESPEIGEEIYRPGASGAPLELAQRRLEEKSKSVQDLREAQKDQGFMRRLSLRLKRSPSTERKEEVAKEEDSSTPRRRLSWTLGRRGSQDKKDIEMSRSDGAGSLIEQEDKELRKPNESPVLAMRRKIESTVAGISTRIRSYSEERRASEDKENKRTPIFSMIRRATSESRSTKVGGVPQNQLASQAGNGASSESLDSMSSLKQDLPKGGYPSQPAFSNMYIKTELKRSFLGFSSQRCGGRAQVSLGSMGPDQRETGQNSLAAGHTNSDLQGQQLNTIPPVLKTRLR